MESFTEWERTYQRAVRVKPFPTLDKAKEYATKKAKGIPFVSLGQRVIWTKRVGHVS